MRIVIIGPQGSGKGTQAETLARHRNLAYVSTGDIFRAHVKNETVLGNKVSDFMHRGLLVPDELTNALVAERLRQPDCTNGFVLDGYPRNLVQRAFLDTLVPVNAVVVIDLDDQEAIRRLSGRLACKCGVSYHVEHNPPKVEGKCDRCGQELFRRHDDQPEVIAERLRTYHLETEPVVDAYAQAGLVRHVDGSRSIEAVADHIEVALRPIQA